VGRDVVDPGGPDPASRRRHQPQRRHVLDRDRCAITGVWPQMPTPDVPNPERPPFLYTWDGTALSTATPVTGLRDVDCAVSGRCIAVRGDLPPMFGTFDEWQEMPVPPAVLTTVSCTMTTCMAAGHVPGRSGDPRPAAYRFSYGAYR
jgi:hypothetical protein